MKKNEPYIAIVVAAGLSERMGSLKPLLDLGGRPTLYRLIDSIIAAGIETIIVVTGHEHVTIENAMGMYKNEIGLHTSSCALDGEKRVENTIYRLLTMNNEAYKTGMFSSVKTGIQKVSELLQNADLSAHSHMATLLFLADVPLVSADTIRGLIKEWENFGLSICFVDKICVSEKDSENGSASSQISVQAEPFAVPVYEGKNGHPLLIPKGHYDEILSYTGSGGLKAIRNNHKDSMVRYETKDKGCVLDMNTQDDYAALLDYLNEKKTPFNK